MTDTKGAAFVRSGPARWVFKLPPTPKVIIAGPEALTVDELRTVKAEFMQAKVPVSASRTDMFFNFEEFAASCVEATHLVLFVGEHASRDEQRMLSAAIAAEVQRVALVCLGTSDALARHVKLAKLGKVNLVVVRSPLDHTQIAKQLGGCYVSHTLVVPDLIKSAHEIVRATLVGSR